MADTAAKITQAFEAACAVEDGGKEAAHDVLALLEIPVISVMKGMYDPGPVVGEHIECLFERIATEPPCDWPNKEEITTLDVPSPAARVGDFRDHRPMPTYGPGLFPQRGIALLYGPPKVGKTQWLIDRLHTWTPLDMFRESTPKEAHRLKVVFLSLESVRSVVASVDGRRLRQLERGYRHPTSARVLAPYAGDLNLTDSASISEFVGSLEPRKLPPGLKLSKDAGKLQDDLSCPDVVVLDSLSRAIAGQDENSALVMSAAVEGLQKLQDAMGAVLLVVLHHTPKDGGSPRGHGALLGGVDCAVRLTARGVGDKAVTVATCTDARDFEDGRSIRYTREVTEWTDLCKPGPLYSFLDYTESPTDEPKATPDTSASKPTSALPDAPAKPVKADAPPAAPKAPDGPHLRGLPLAVWSELALKPGDKLALADARERIMGGAVFAGVDSRRRAQKLADVLASFERAGLVVGDHLTYPPPAEG